MRTKALSKGALSLLLRAMYKPNRTVCLIALATGLRVSDVLNIKTEQLRRSSFTVTEQKTGKRKRVRLPEFLRADALEGAGKVYAFPHRLDWTRPRTRQAVWKDLRRAARALGAKRFAGAAPHSMRKSFAVDLRERGFTPAQIQRALNHSSPLITALYSAAEVIEID